MADLKISALNSLAGADLVAADVVAVVDDSASETKKLTVSDLIANGSTLISDNTIPSAKILFSAGSIDTAELAASAVETAKINDSAVTAAKLADNSSVTLVSTLPASGDFTGQIALDTDDDKIYVWDGSAWDSVKGAGSINVVNGSTTGEINIVASTSGDTVTISATLDDTTAAAQFLGGPTGAGGTVGYRALVGTDLPTASTTAKGGVIVNGNGLTMSSDTIAIDNTVTAEATDHHIVQYDANGLVTGGRVIAAADVPVATSTTIGVVKPGSGLGVTGAGELNHDNSVTAGTAAKVTFDTEGHITGTESLVAADIPDLDADKITSGSFPTARIASDAITADKLANYTVAQISETTPTADFTSQFFFNPITRDLFLWDGNVFQPVGISAGEIVLAGTYDASTNLLDSVTADGTAAGFTNGASLPAAAAGNNRHYVVVSQSGTGSAPAPTVTLEPPDILLSNGTSYVLIETSETITAQIASNVGFTPTGNIAGTNVQAAVAEVDSEKLAKGGDTMTGDLTLNNVNIVFEGATENEYETTLTVTDPTADRTLTLPDNTGNLVSTGDTGSVTSAMIADGTIVNADISSTAEIAVNKLANGTARQLLQTDVAGSGVEFTSNIDVPGTLDVTGAATLDSTLAVTGATTVTGVINADGKVKFPAGTASAPSFYSGTDTNTGLYFSAADEISVATGGTQRVVVDSSGNVGIGTSSPAAKLEIGGIAASGQTEVFTIDRSDGTQLFSIESDHTNNAVNLSGNTKNFVFKNGSSSSETMRIDSSGNVGIGTSSIDRLLHVQGAGTSGTQVQIEGTSASAGLKFVPASGDNWEVQANTNSDLIVYNRTDGAQRLTIDSSGNVGIGTSSPTRKLHVYDASTAYIQLTTAGSTQSASGGFQIVHNGAGDLRANLIQRENAPMTFSTNDTERMRIDSSGNVGINRTAPDNQLSIGSTASFHTDANSFYLGSNFTSTGSNFIGSSKHAQRLFFNNASGNGYLAYANTSSTGTAGNSITWEERLRIDSSGRLLVGTSSSYGVADADDLQIGDNTTSPERGLTIGSTTGGNIAFADAGDSRAGLIQYNHSNNEFRLFTNGVSGGSKVIIDSSGRLLVGTTSARGRYTLQLEGNSESSTDVGEIWMGRPLVDASINSGTGLGKVYFGGQSGGVGARIEGLADAQWGTNDYPGRLVFSTTADGASSPTERMRITNDGLFKFSNDNSYSLIDAGAHGFRQATTGNWVLEAVHGASTGNVYGIHSQFGSITPNNTSSWFYLGSDSSATNRYIVYSNGGIANYQSNNVNLCDEREKKNIETLDSTWGCLKNWELKKFHYNEDADTDDKRYGVIAQQVEQHCPEVLTEWTKQKAQEAVLDDDGNVVTPAREEILRKGVKEQQMMWMAIKALQEAQDRIETLETKVAALEAG